MKKALFILLGAMAASLLPGHAPVIAQTTMQVAVSASTLDRAPLASAKIYQTNVAGQAYFVDSSEIHPLCLPNAVDIHTLPSVQMTLSADNLSATAEVDSSDYSRAVIVLTDVNNQLCEGNEAELFVTVWLAIVQLSTGKGMAANAGHEHPALRHKDGSFELIEYRHSPAVATMEGIRFREHEFELLPGDTVYEYTDGVSEATDANDELFGNDRLIAALNKESDAGVEALLKNVRMEIDRFVKDAPQFDDITMLGFQFYGDGVDDNAEDGRSCGNS